MRKRLLSLLQCNNCRQHPLQIDNPSLQSGKDIIEKARLNCPNCKITFFVQDGIPEFLQTVSPGIKDEIKSSEDVARMWAKQESVYNEAYLLSLPYVTDPRVSNYAGWRRKAFYFSQMLGIIPDCKNKILLELGAGTTWATRYFVKKGYYAIALEIVKVHLRGLATSKFYQERERIYYENILAPMENVPLKKSSMDVIFSINLLHHSYNLQAVFSEFFRLLKDDGSAYVMEDGVGLMQLCSKRKEAEWSRSKMHHYDHAYTFNNYKRAIHKAGLTYELIIPQKFLDGISIFKKLPSKLLTLFYRIVLFIRGCGFIICLKKDKGGGQSKEPLKTINILRKYYTIHYAVWETKNESTIRVRYF